MKLAKKKHKHIKPKREDLPFWQLLKQPERPYLVWSGKAKSLGELLLEYHKIYSAMK